MKVMSRTGLFVSITAAAVLLLGCNHDAENGKQVFNDQCSGCHNADSTDRKVGPGLKGLFQHDKLPISGKNVSVSNVRARIDEGGNGMPPFDQVLSDQDKTALMAYLKTI